MKSSTCRHDQGDDPAPAGRRSAEGRSGLAASEGEEVDVLSARAFLGSGTLAGADAMFVGETTSAT
jgi:hypothetical protein